MHQDSFQIAVRDILNVSNCLLHMCLLYRKLLIPTMPFKVLPGKIAIKTPAARLRGFYPSIFWGNHEGLFIQHADIILLALPNEGRGQKASRDHAVYRNASHRSSSNGLFVHSVFGFCSVCVNPYFLYKYRAVSNSLKVQRKTLAYACSRQKRRAVSSSFFPMPFP